MTDFARNIRQEFTVIHCGRCGGSYALDEGVRSNHQEYGTSWNCPYCKTSWGYHESEADELRKQLEKERKKTKRAEWERTNAENSLRTQKGVNTKLKNRVKEGVCPCCHRTFKQLAAHMKNKHPGFQA